MSQRPTCQIREESGLGPLSPCGGPQWCGDCRDVVRWHHNNRTHPFKVSDGLHCMDCGVEVEKPFQPGSARCASCWDDRCGGAGEAEL
jgi:hypothetical protein